MTTIAHPHAEDVAFVSDENGWELHVRDEVGTLHIFNVHHLTSGLLGIARPLENYWMEGLAAAAEYVPPPSREDLDAYEPGDPKRISLERAADGG